MSGSLIRICLGTTVHLGNGCASKYFRARGNGQRHQTLNLVWLQHVCPLLELRVNLCVCWAYFLVNFGLLSPCIVCTVTYPNWELRKSIARWFNLCERNGRYLLLVWNHQIYNFYIAIFSTVFPHQPSTFRPMLIHVHSIATYWGQPRRPRTSGMLESSSSIRTFCCRFLRWGAGSRRQNF